MKEGCYKKIIELEKELAKVKRCCGMNNALSVKVARILEKTYKGDYVYKVTGDSGWCQVSGNPLYLGIRFLASLHREGLIVNHISFDPKKHTYNINICEGRYETYYEAI